MKVKFSPQNVEFEIKPGQSVLHVAQDHGIYIKSVCKGVPNCAECRVRVTEGEHNVTPPGSEELALIGTGHFIDRRRLSCQLKCFGDITVDMTEQLAKEQNILVGKKKKLSAKDDRVEQAVARRSEDSLEPIDSDAAHSETTDAPSSARPPRDQNRERPQRDARPAQQRSPRDGGRDTRGAGQNQNQNGGPRPQGQGPQQARDSQSRPGQGPQAPRPQADARPQVEPRPQGAAPGEGGEGSGAPRKRRRRRGKGGGGGGQGPSGSPQGNSGAPPSRPGQ